MAEADRERWDQRHRERGFTSEVSPLIKYWADRLPQCGRALDVAGGSGRHALWLAERGLETTLIDIAPSALDLAARESKARGLALETHAVDLESEPFPEGPWDLILSFHYLQRSLFPVFAKTLAPGGVLVFVQPTETNLERHPRPSARFLLRDGELSSLLDRAGLVAVDLREGWLEESRYEAAVLARKVLRKRKERSHGAEPLV